MDIEVIYGHADMSTPNRPAPLILHVIHRLAVGGLENGLVNLINTLPRGRYRHAIVSLTDVSDFRQRITVPDVDVYALHRRPGVQPGLYWQLYRLMRRLRPDIVHTRNLATLEAQLPAWLARVPIRLHGEHGRDMHDLDNTRARYRRLRRTLSPLIHGYIALSRELMDYLVADVGITADKITRICNGVDSERFAPRQGDRERPVWPAAFASPHDIVIGTVGRMETVKDPLNLARAFASLCSRRPDLSPHLRLVMIGDGSQRGDVESSLSNAGLKAQAWLPGSRDDIPDLLPDFDIFALPSLAEGISNTILEAMSCGLPVVATAVGGNGELIETGVTGELVPRDDADAMAAALERYADDGALRQAHGHAARARIERDYSLNGMVERYAALYDHHLASVQKHGRQRRHAA